MTTKNLQSLDRASAERIMKWEIYSGYCDGVYQSSYRFHGPKFDIGKGKTKDWSPSSPNSGQIFLVLDAMELMDFEIDLNFDDGRLIVTIHKYRETILSVLCTDISKRNQTILECCLEAIDKSTENKV